MKVREVEARISAIEGFNVRMLYYNGRDVRGDLDIAYCYTFKRCAPNRFTVDAWVRGRARYTHPGLYFQVLDERGMPVAGNTRLKNLRARYAAK